MAWTQNERRWTQAWTQKWTQKWTQNLRQSDAEIPRAAQYWTQNGHWTQNATHFTKSVSNAHDRSKLGTPKLRTVAGRLLDG
jgi:hypothetical protein